MQKHTDLYPADIIALMTIYSLGSMTPEYVVIPLWLEERGLVTKTGECAPWFWEVTDGGRMLVDALCKTPVPVMKWSMP